MATVLRLLGIGWYVALCIVGGIAGGRWLDGRLGVDPVFTLLGLAVGIAVAGLGTYRMLNAVLANARDSSEDQRIN